MKTLNKIFSVLRDLFPPQIFISRISPETVNSNAGVVGIVHEKKSDFVFAIPKEYLYSRLDEIEDETWVYSATVNSGI